MNIKVINESSRSLPGELLNAVSEWKTFDDINSIADEYNLRIRSVRFVYDENELPVEQEITVGDSFATSFAK
jgi:hypothetical protein